MTSTKKGSGQLRFRRCFKSSGTVHKARCQAPFFGSGGGETNTRTKNYLTVGPSGSGASLYLSFGLPSRPRSLAKRDTKKEEERERELDLRRQFIEKQGGVKYA